MINNALRIRKREVQKKNAQEAAAAKLVVKNTETAKQNGGIHNERVFLNEAGWDVLFRQIDEYLDDGEIS